MIRITKKSWLWTTLAVVLLGGIAAGGHFYRQTHSAEKLCADAQQMEKQGNYNDALYYYWAAEKIIRSRPDDVEKLAEVYMKLGGIYFAINKNNNAMTCYENAGKIWSLNHSSSIIQVNSNLATIYLETHQLKRARYYYLLALSEIEKRNAVQLVGYHNIARVYYYLADTCFELNLSAEAEIYFLKSLNATSQAGNFGDHAKLKAKAFWRLCELYYRNKNYSQALTG